MSRPSAETTPADAPGSVRRRHVFYVSGFDPKGPAHYHRLLTEQAVLAGALGGYRVDVGGRRRGSDHSARWTLSHFSTPTATEPDVETVFEFLRWDDIVREHWTRNPARLAWQLVTTTLLYLRTGALWRMLKLAWPPVLALFAPFLLLIGLLASVPTAWLSAAWAADRTGSWSIGVLVGLAVLGAAAGVALWAERRLNVQWLLRSYAFTALQGTRGCPPLEQRLDWFAARIVERMQAAAGCDELLIVAHSSGSIMATAALARALRLDPRLGGRGPQLSLLTLGQWSPLLSSLPTARRFRAELATVDAERSLDWVDFTAPPDGCCFALTDPIAAAGLPASRPDHPRLLSPRFAELFSPAGYAMLRRDRFRLHFQYLMAGEHAGDYDFIGIVAGSSMLGARFANQASVTDFKRFRRFG